MRKCLLKNNFIGLKIMEERREAGYYKRWARKIKQKGL